LATGRPYPTLNTFPDLCALHRANPERYPHLLESVAHGNAQARYDILFAFPQSTLLLESNGRVSQDDRRLEAAAFLDVLDHAWSKERRLCPQQHDRTAKSNAPPFKGGWFVYLGYELAAEIESVLTGHTHESSFPVACATRFPAAVIRNHTTRSIHLVCEPDKQEDLLPLLRADVKRVTPHLSASPVMRPVNEEDPSRFLDSVRRIQSYIEAGDVFQVNLSRLWNTTLASTTMSADLYQRLRVTNPAPFSGMATFPDNRAIISSSPERLVQVCGTSVRTRPIAGTYPRSRVAEQDRAWSQELLKHPKERAEHVMLIDLERNDLGRVCRAGSVHVSELMALESYRHVHHIVSEVSGELKEGVTPAQVIRAVFPGGTITGCPKVRCMQIIAELEQAPRGAYTGSMGYINHDGDMDLNILIRTFMREGDTLSLRAGAGIVADSIPQRELDETRAKAKGLLAALGGI
jgi:anthranilate synthase component I